MLPLLYIFSFNISLNVIKQKYHSVPFVYVSYITHTSILCCFFFYVYYNASVNSNCAQPPPPPTPGLLRRGICLPCESRGGAFGDFALPGGRAFANPGAISELLTRTQFPIRIQLDKRFYWKKSRLAQKEIPRQFVM